MWIFQGFKKQNDKKRGISNLTNVERNSNFSGSNFLEKEYHLVQRIISDTKELKSIKIKNETPNKTDSVSQVTTRQIVPQYKSQEEYYQEVLELKKVYYFKEFLMINYRKLSHKIPRKKIAENQILVVRNFKSKILFLKQ